MIIVKIKEFLDVKEKLKLGKNVMKKHRKIIISIVIIIVLALVLPLPKRMKVTLKGRKYPDNQAEVTAAIDAVYLDWLVLKDRFYGKIYLEPYYEDVEKRLNLTFKGVMCIIYRYRMM